MCASNRTVEQACEDWLAAKHAYRRELSTVHGYREKLSVVVTQLGGIELQKTTKRHVDDLVAALRAGGLKSPPGKTRKLWIPRSVNYLLGLLTAVMETSDVIYESSAPRLLSGSYTRLCACDWF